MEIIEFFETDKKEYWLSKIKESDWGAGQYLYQLLDNQKLKGLAGYIHSLIIGGTIMPEDC